MAEKPADPRLLGLTAQIIAAHAANTSMEPATLPIAIREVYKALATLGQSPSPRMAQQEPAVPVQDSVFPDYIICLEDGKPMKMLKRHLLRSFNMTPEDYRRKWGLDPNYPMVAPNYAERRSVLAKQNGLGQRRPTEDEAAD
jgi:predicted transcriptional regulator